MRYRGMRFLGISLILSSSVIGIFYYKGRHAAPETIRVTGTAVRRVPADTVRWHITLGTNVERKALPEGCSRLRRELELTKKYLLFNGIREKDIVVRPVVVEQGEGWHLQQTITALSTNVGAVERLAAAPVKAGDEEVQIEAAVLEYQCAKAPELRLRLLEEATADARLRAERIAQCAGVRAGAMLAAEADALRVNEPSAGAGDDAAFAREKELSISVTAAYAVR